MKHYFVSPQGKPRFLKAEFEEAVMQSCCVAFEEQLSEEQWDELKEMMEELAKENTAKSHGYMEQWGKLSWQCQLERLPTVLQSSFLELWDSRPGVS